MKDRHGQDSALPMQGAHVRSLVRELGPTCHKLTPRMPQQRTCLPVQEMWFPFMSQEDPLEKEMATHFSLFVWQIP